MTEPNEQNEVTLTPRQTEVMELLIEGLSDSEIAKKAYMSESRIKGHLRAVSDKLYGHESYNRVQLAVWYVTSKDKLMGESWVWVVCEHPDGWVVASVLSDLDEREIAEMYPDTIFFYADLSVTDA